MDSVKRFRIAFWITFSVLVLAIGVGGYFFYTLNNWKEDIILSKDQKIASQAADLAALTSSGTAAGKDKATLTAENEKLNADKTALTAENTDLNAGIKKALAYNTFFKYLNTVIDTHDGFSGWTDAEFQTGKTKAEATGDASFVSTINWAWYQTDVDPTTRVIRVWNEIVSGIANALK